MRLFNIILIILIPATITAIIAIFIFPDSSITPQSIELISRPYKDHQNELSPSPIINALLNRYEENVGPLTTRKKNDPVVRSNKYFVTTGLLAEMTDATNTHVRMFQDHSNVYVFTLKIVRNTLDGYTTNEELQYFPLITRIALFTIPKHTLLTKEIDLDLTDENSELNLCWESYLPGISVGVAFSTDYKVLGITYRLIVSGGVSYRIRYYPSLTCDSKLTEKPNSNFYNRYVNLTMRKESTYTKYYDDIYLNAYSHISSFAVLKDKIVYSLTYDSYLFHILKKNRTWDEGAVTEKIRRNVNLYEFCHDLFITKLNGTEMIIALTKSGLSLTSLNEKIIMYEIKTLDNTITEVYSHRFDKQVALYFTLADLTTPPIPTSFLIVNKDNSSIFVNKNYDKVMLLEYKSNNKPSWGITILDEWINSQSVSATNDLSVIVTYPKEGANVLFYVDNNDVVGKFCLLVVEKIQLSLPQLPKKLSYKEIVGMILLESKNTTEKPYIYITPNRDKLILGLLFEGGNILKVYIDKDELADIEWLSPFWYFIPEYLLTMFITLFLASIPIWAGVRIFSRLREGFRRRQVNPNQRQFNFPRNAPPRPAQIPQPNAPMNVQPEPQQNP